MYNINEQKIFLFKKKRNRKSKELKSMTKYLKRWIDEIIDSNVNNWDYYLENDNSLFDLFKRVLLNNYHVDFDDNEWNEINEYCNYVIFEVKLNYE